MLTERLQSAQTRRALLRADGFLCALALRPVPEGALGRPLVLAALAAHALGLLAVFRMAHWPLPLAPLALIGLLQTHRLAQRSLAQATAGLTPLAALYLTAAVRLGLTRFTDLDIPAFLDYRWSAALVGLWIGLGVLPRRHALRAGLVASLAWAGYLYALNRPAGVTGADPFAYVQMGMDIATSGLPLHRFPLADLAFDLNLPVYPTLHVGYTIPYGGASASVWPPGYSALLAAAYRVAGEPGMYWLNPALGVLGALATLFLAAQLLRDHPRRHLVGGLAAFLLITSSEQAIRLAVPLADVAAQVFSTLALALALYAAGAPNTERSTSNVRRVLPVLAGLTFGLAYDIRYTQLLLAPAFLYIGWTAPRRGRFLIPFFSSALLAALPDLGYRWLAFGSPLAFGSEELAWFSAAAIPESLARVGTEIMAGPEFGMLLPFLGLGLIALPGRARWVLGLGLLPPLLFHLPYAFLKSRDLLWLFPALAILSALGADALAVRVPARLAGDRAPTAHALLRALAVGSVLVVALIRIAGTLPLRQGFMTFGFLQPQQRASLERLADVTEPEAVIASSLNSGAVELYGRRLAVRPGRLLQPGKTWTDAQWLEFAAALLDGNRPLYVLMDGVEMQDPKTTLESRYTLTHVADLDLPYYYHGGGSDNLRVALYRVGDG